MRIQSIEIIDYKVFWGTSKIPVGGKNVFISGENDSCKCNLFEAPSPIFCLVIRSKCQAGAPEGEVVS